MASGGQNKPVSTNHHQRVQGRPTRRRNMVWQVDDVYVRHRSRCLHVQGHRARARVQHAQAHQALKVRCSSCYSAPQSPLTTRLHLLTVVAPFATTVNDFTCARLHHRVRVGASCGCNFVAEHESLHSLEPHGLFFRLYQNSSRC